MTNDQTLQQPTSNPTPFLASVLQIQHPSERGRCLAINKCDKVRCGNTPAAKSMKAAENIMHSIWQKAVNKEQITDELLELSSLMTCKVEKFVNHQDQVPGMVVEWSERLKKMWGFAHVEVPEEQQLRKLWLAKTKRGTDEKERIEETEYAGEEDRDDNQSTSDGWIRMQFSIILQWWYGSRE